MLRREDCEKREYEILSEDAVKAAESKGRLEPEEQCEFRTVFQRDRDRIVHSKALRRLMHKTQVFLAPEKDHFRTRLTHTLEVAQISKSIARALRLNEDLTEAIALGHDLGHTPFGHIGEYSLAKIHKNGFKHNEQSLRVVDVLESKPGRRGMNLTLEVRDGILNHTGDIKPFTLEGQIVKISDRIAYVNHDIDDALRSEIISENDLPKEELEFLGKSTNKRIDSLIKDMIFSSEDSEEIRQSSDHYTAMMNLRTFLFDKVYSNKKVMREADQKKIDNVIFGLYNYYIENNDELPNEYKLLIDEYGLEETVKDNIAGMTDRFARDTYVKLFVPPRFSG